MSLIDKIIDYGWAQGFGLVILDDDTRLHLWHPKWPVTDVPTIHSHNYWFKSKVLVGEMISPEFTVAANPEGNHNLIVGTVTKEKLMNPDRCDLRYIGKIRVKTGEEYTFGGSDRYHVNTVTGLVLTHFEVLPIPKDKDSGFLLPPDLTPKQLTPRPKKPELREVVLRLLEEYNL